ncbi:hypothetical protein AVEN_220766-1 [Araneus ventricosus]|uniref:Uncharacterized protein n=1 Tax=Araneus ventricosus TaxID=182803 RepID=A0A4Y2LUU0_ARAVE|nr:hypothetical protein AVEN_220766-1 [Araneus ventricosus]
MPPTGGVGPWQVMATRTLASALELLPWPSLRYIGLIMIQTELISIQKTAPHEMIKWDISVNLSAVWLDTQQANPVLTSDLCQTTH